MASSSHARAAAKVWRDQPSVFGREWGGRFGIDRIFVLIEYVYIYIHRYIYIYISYIYIYIHINVYIYIIYIYIYYYLFNAYIYMQRFYRSI